MDMQGHRPLAVTQQQAWDALNDPQVLKACIPGCDKIEATGDNQYSIGMAVKIGPVSAKFAGKITLSDIQPPQSYTIGFDGQGGVAGFGKGTAQVQLSPTDTGCDMHYTVNAQVGGKIAQLGQRLIDGAAKSMAEDFFKRFDEEMQSRYPSEDTQASTNPAQPDAKDLATHAGSDLYVDDKKFPHWVWVAAILVLLALWYLSR